MLIFALVVALLIGVVLHEMGHALAMRRHGLSLQEAGLGFGPRLLTWQPRWLSYPLKLRLLPLGAYVRLTPADEERLKTMPYVVQADCTGAGITMNLLTTGIIVVVLTMVRWLGGQPITGLQIAFIISGLAITAGCLWLRQWICAYGLPVLSLGALGVIIWSIIADPTQAIGGPITSYNLISASGLGELPYWYTQLLLLAFISLSLALINVLPLFVLDGGYIVEALLRGRVSDTFIRVWRTASVIVLLGIFYLAILSDILQLNLS